MKNNIFRMPFIFLQAALVTLLLLTLMISLIELADPGLNERKRIKLPDIHMPEVEAEIQRLIEKPQKPEVDDTPPPEIPEQDFDRIDGNAAVGRISAGKIDAEMDLNIGAGLQATDGEYLPIVKVAAQYPRRAASRGIEGFVIIEYTVTSQGTVRDPVVIESRPPGVFDRAAIKSVLRYKYKPRVVDGKPIETPGVRTRVTFEISK